MNRQDFIEYLSIKYKFDIKQELEVYEREIHQDVFQLCSEFIGIPLQVLGQKSRKNEFKVPRFVCMWYVWNFRRIGLKNIGMAFGNRDHSTIINARDKVDDAIITKDRLYVPYLRRMRPLIPTKYWEEHLLWVNETAAN